MDNLKDALDLLDPLDDDQWTADGNPRVDAVEKILGEPVTRQQIVDAAPDLNRSKLLNPEDEDNEDPENEDPENEDPENEDPDPDLDNEEEEEDLDEVEEVSDEAEDEMVLSEAELNNYIRGLNKQSDLEELVKQLSNQQNSVSSDIEKLKESRLNLKRAISLANVCIREMNPSSN